MEPSERAVFSCPPLIFSPESDQYPMERLDRRKAIAVAGNDEMSVQYVMAFVDSLGIDPFFIGTLNDTRILESGGAAFGTNLTYDQLSCLVAIPTPNQ